jgi:hypothetical protein
MPPLNAEQVTPSTKVDIIAYLLQVNGFPLGTTELSVDPDTLESLQIVRKGKDSTRAPNFALVQVVGCLRQDPSGRWILTNSTDPTVTKEEAATPTGLKAAETIAIGTETFELVSVVPSFKPESHKDHRMEARGLLYREPSHAELNLTSLAMIASTCAK